MEFLAETLPSGSAIIRDLAKNSEIRIRCAVAKNPNIDEQTQKILLSSNLERKDWVWGLLINNKNVSNRILEEVINNPLKYGASNVFFAKEKLKERKSQETMKESHFTNSNKIIKTSRVVNLFHKIVKSGEKW